MNVRSFVRFASVMEWLANQTMFQDYVWDVCSERLDIQIPFTLQPSDKIQQIVDNCLETFPNYSADTPRKRIRAFLKNSRKKRKLSSQEEEEEEEDTANGESKVSKVQSSERTEHCRSENQFMKYL